MSAPAAGVALAAARRRRGKHGLDRRGIGKQHRESQRNSEELLQTAQLTPAQAGAASPESG
jgi:hypothetical protein